MVFVARLMTPVLLALALAAPKVLATQPTIDLTPRVGPNDFAEVTIELEMGGTMAVRDTTKQRAADTGQPAERTLPMSVSAKLVYDEQRVAAPSGSAGARNTFHRGIRYYKQADAVIKVDNDGVLPKLDEERRLVVAQNPGGRLQFTAASGQLSREELDLIDLTCDSLAVDALLPNRSAVADATWPANPNAMAALLSMDSVAAAEVENVLDKFNSDFALIRIAGTVVGSVDGSTTELEIRGVYLFDSKLGRVTRCNLAVKENRSIGGATPGLDGIAKLRMNVKPLESSPHLPAKTTATLASSRRLDLDTIRLEPAKQGFRVLHDRRWFVTSQERESTTLRCVDRGDVLAQCTFTSLPAKSAGRQTSLEEFERDIRFAMKQNFGELVSSRQWDNSFGHHCLEVIVRGKTEEIPIEWHYYLVAPNAGARVSVAVTIQGEMVSRLAAADRQLINVLELLPGNNAAETAAKIETRR